MSRGNGEGTIYETIQKIKKDFDNTNICKVCSECNNKTICNNREGWIKCNKCKECKGDKTCDRFYIYKKTFAQISTQEGRKTVGNGKTKKEVNEKKEQKETELKIKERIKFGDLTLEEAMKENETRKLKNKQINENSYLRNLEVINSICSHKISQYKISNIALNDIEDCLLYFVEKKSSQSQLDKVYDEMKSAFKLCNIDIMDTIKRDTFISEVEKKEVIAFSIEEEKLLLNYINKNENVLICNNKSKIDSKTVKKFNKICFSNFNENRRNLCIK